MSSQEYICVVWEDTDNIMTWLVPLDANEEPEDTMRRHVVESDKWPFNHWSEYEFATHANEWRCFQLVTNTDTLNRLKKIQWPPTADTSIDPYDQGLHKLAVFEAFAA